MAKRATKTTAADSESVPADVPAEPMVTSEQEERTIQHLSGGEVVAEDSPIYLNVRGCSACGGDHDGVLEFPLPEDQRIDLLHNYYYNCPATGQKVYVQHLEN